VDGNGVFFLVLESKIVFVRENFGALKLTGAGKIISFKLILYFQLKNIK
jgi:hypothetical protein